MANGNYFMSGIAYLATLIPGDMKKKLINTFLIDIVIFCLFLYSAAPDESASMGLIFLVPFIFIVNLIAAIAHLLNATIILKQKDSQQSTIYFINAFVAPVIFFLMFFIAVRFHSWKTIKTYTFSVNKNNYELTLYLEEKMLRLSQIDGRGYYEGLFSGTYRESNDTIYFDKVDYGDSTAKLRIFDKKLTGFPLNPGAIKLHKK